MRTHLRLYAASSGDLPGASAAVLTLTDLRDAACLVPSGLAPSARFYLRSVDCDDAALTDSIVAVLRRPSIQSSDHTASGSCDTSAGGVGPAIELYGTPSYWRIAVGLLEHKLPLKIDARDWAEMWRVMNGAAASAADAEGETPDDAPLGDVDDRESAPLEDARNWLKCLDADPVCAAEMFQQYRRELTRFLSWQHDDPESAAQEALIRGLRRIARGADTSKSGVRGFLFGFGRNIVKEGWKVRTRERPLDDGAALRRQSASREHARVEARMMLRDVLGRLSPRDRQIIVRYCTETDHTAHCRELGVTAGNLRIIVHRIRVAIREWAARPVDE